jgi:uncharacterized protein YkwD
MRYFFIALAIIASIVFIIFYKYEDSSFGKYDTSINNITDKSSSNSIPPLSSMPDNSVWDQKLLDTARNVDYLTTKEKDFIYETNKLRSNPLKYAEAYIRTRLNRFAGKVFITGTNVNILTKEGVDAYKEAFNVLINTKPLPLQYPSRGISLAARDHAEDMIKNDFMEHEGSNGSDPATRVSAYGIWGKSIGENISLGDSEGREILIDLVVDDGVSDRGHRKNILSSDFKYLGISSLEKKDSKTITVIDYAGEYKEK